MVPRWRLDRGKNLVSWSLGPQTIHGIHFHGAKRNQEKNKERNKKKNVLKTRKSKDIGRKKIHGWLNDCRNNDKLVELQ